MTPPSAIGRRRRARFRAYDGHDAAFRDREAAALAEHNEKLLAAYVEGRPGSARQRRGALSEQTRAGVMHPVFAGSAVTGAGVLDLMRGIQTLLPDADGELDASPSGRVFKIERGTGGEKVAYVRMVDGSIRPRPRTDQGPALRAVLAELADQDPLIDVRTGNDGLPTVSLYGRVQQEVLGSTLAEEYGIDVVFADAAVLHVERPQRLGAAVARLNTDANPYQATVGLRISPGRTGSGLRFANRAAARDMPLYLYKSVQAFTAAVERHVRRALEHGLYGWRVTDALVTLTDVGYSVADGPPSRRGRRAPRTTSARSRQSWSPRRSGGPARASASRYCGC